MKMVRNDSLARIAMLVFFGTAVFFLAVHWRITSFIASPQSSKRVTTLVDKGIPNQKTAEEQKQNQVKGALQSQKAPSSKDAVQNTKVVVDLSDRRVYVYRSNQVIASYPTGIGKEGWETPIGVFQVTQMLHHPIWRHPITGKIFEAGVDSPLGERWIGFWSDGRNQIGFHGTPEEELVGTAVSHGCLRMRNQDVRLLFSQVNMGTPVEVQQ